MKKLFLILTVLSFIIGCAGADVKTDSDNIHITNMEEVEDYLQDYFRTQNRDIIDSCLSYLIYGEEEVVNEDNEAPILSFFCKYFTDNEKLRKIWLKKIKNTDSKNKYFMKVLRTALNSDHDDLMSKYEISPEQNDFFWGAFFASGDLRYVRSIVRNLEFLNDKTDQLKYLAACTAKWSLSSNAETYPEIKIFLEKEAASGSNYKIQIYEILKKSSAQIEDESSEFIEERLKNGDWEIDEEKE